LRTSARTWDSDRPRRSTVTSISTGPAATGAANTVVSVRSGTSSAAAPGSAAPSGPASSRAIARAVRAAITPPCGTIGQFQSALTSSR
jgi:hypothetical protein